MTAEKLITEICVPWVSNTALFLILGLALDAVAPGVTAALLTGVAPMALIFWLIRRGRVGDHHVIARNQRGVCSR
ncbi:hypothetical protein [Corynebacterium halotolerans]|uniref:hypothetical protein n=1 Tax=Corynebacterium halotolerans TaxID=225326 RepID=UPI00034A5FC8|nr:hypothetical protein [Corynebacterium halotolerans]